MHRTIWLGIVFLLLATSAGCRSEQAVARLVPSPASVQSGEVALAVLPTATNIPAALAESISSTATPLPAISTATPFPIPSATPRTVQTIQIGTGLDHEPLTLYRLGSGPQHAFVLGGIGGASDANSSAVLDEIVANGDSLLAQLPPSITLWIVPSINAFGRSNRITINEHGVDLSIDSNVSLDGCSRSQTMTARESGTVGWQLTELDSFLRAADAVLIIRDGPEAAVARDSCGLHRGAGEQARFVSDVWDVSLVDLGENTGRLTDYLASFNSSVAELILNQTMLPTLNATNILAWTTRVATVRQPPTTWQFSSGTLQHPLAVERINDVLFVLDRGRIVSVPIDPTLEPTIILESGSMVEGVRVLELLDMAVDNNDLLALDRAGDVYRWQADAWRLERYDRPVGELSSHYYLSLASSGTQQFLLESSYQFVQQFQAESDGILWLTGEQFDVDIVADGETVFVLKQAQSGAIGSVQKYQAGFLAASFALDTPIYRPRQLALYEDTLFVLDYAGYRISAFDRISGTLKRQISLGGRHFASAMMVDQHDGRLLLAGPDRLLFEANVTESRSIASSQLVTVAAAHSLPALHFNIRGLMMPASGSLLPIRNNRMPGAPRHYRLGVHAGLDLYWQTGKPIRAVADGIVFRADHAYITPTEALFQTWRTEATTLGYTSEAATDFYRGRQIWIQHENGLISRYAHLSVIYGNVAVGSAVEAGELLGEVGNSGSPSMLINATADSHLHVELWIGSNYAGQYARPIETRDWLTFLFNL